MKVEHGQTHIDLAVLGYGNQAGYFKIANDNAQYEATVENPYAEMEFPVKFSPGEDLSIDVDSELYITEQIKELNRSRFKAASAIEFDDFNNNDFNPNDFQ